MVPLGYRPNSQPSSTFTWSYLHSQKPSFNLKNKHAHWTDVHAHAHPHPHGTPTRSTHSTQIHTAHTHTHGTHTARTHGTHTRHTHTAHTRHTHTAYTRKTSTRASRQAASFGEDSHAPQRRQPRRNQVCCDVSNVIFSVPAPGRAPANPDTTEHQGPNMARNCTRNTAQHCRPSRADDTDTGERSQHCVP
jgi:hypothetical protein